MDALTIVQSKSAELASALNEAWQVYASPGWLTPESTVSAWGGALEQVQQLQNDLAPEGKYGRGVEQGSLSLDRWISIFNAAWDQLAFTRREMQLNTVDASNLWTNVVLPTATTIQKGAKAAADAAPGLALGGAAVVVVVLVLVLAIKLS